MKPLVCVFAHPDDESFGPSGTIALEAQKRDVYIICVTQGDAGENSSKEKRPLHELRRDELLASAKLLGVKKVFFLDYHDGMLSNSLYHEVAAKIQAIIDKIKPEILLTFDLRGVSGHIDHIAVALITSYVFDHSPYIREIWHYVMTKEYVALIENYFIFYPPGYRRAEISKIVDTSTVWDLRVKAMFLHASQLHDAKKVLAQLERVPKNENFVVRKQKTKR